MLRGRYVKKVTLYGCILLNETILYLNCNILTSYGLDKSTLMGRLTNLQVKLASFIHVLFCFCFTTFIFLFYE